MNSRDRRKLRRNQARQVDAPGATDTERVSQTGGERHPPQRLARGQQGKRLAPLLTAGRLVWSAIVAASTLLGLWLFWPKFSIEPYASTDPRDPFSEFFSIKNESIYPLLRVSPECKVEQARSRNGIWVHGPSFMSSLDQIPELDPQSSTSFRCEMFFMKFPSADEWSQLEINESVAYSIPLVPYRFGQSQRFSGVRSADGTYIWTSHGSGK